MGMPLSFHRGKCFSNRKSRGGLSSAPGASGFTLIEVLVATSVFMMLILVLASVLNQALGLWSRNENKSDLRESGRTAINLIGSELRQAALPVDRVDDATYRAAEKNLQMVINPATIGDQYKNHDAIFWQAPIATSHSKGDLAIVGYFIRKVGNVSKLCRFFINPDDPDYAVYDDTKPWVSDDLLDKKAPADEASNLQGVFLENVPGMWVTAYQDATTAYPVSPAYDSRVAGKLPSRVEISLALLDSIGAQRVANGQVTLPDGDDKKDLVTFLGKLPVNMRAHVQTVTINVSFPF